MTQVLNEDLLYGRDISSTGNTTLVHAVILTSEIFMLCDTHVVQMYNNIYNKDTNDSLQQKQLWSDVLII